MVVQLDFFEYLQENIVLIFQLLTNNDFLSIKLKYKILINTIYS